MLTLLNKIPRQLIANTIADSTHPMYDLQISDWQKWRLIFESGDAFIEEYTKKFSRREDDYDFRLRKAITPIPAFAKGAINEIKNAIFQRTTDITRKGGSENYQRACKGQLGGVDLRGGNMNWFIGHYILPELLTMKKIGVYVDSPKLGATLADRGNKHPYYCVFRAEDIRSWNPIFNGEDIEYSSLLLREYYYEINENQLPTLQKPRFKHVYLDSGVKIQYYNDLGEKISPLIELNIPRIPFQSFEISESLLKDVANHQIALLNLESSDISFALKGNVPFYTEQYDPRFSNQFIKSAQEAMANEICDTSVKVGDNELEIGTTQGRRYAKDTERPAFIHPSTEPLKVSIEKQDKLKQDIRVLVHLALSNVQRKMASAESKSIDQHGLEAGLSYIGLELEHGEQRLAEFWAMYESNSEIPTISYPKLYSLKTDKEQREEVRELEEIRDSVPSRKFQKEITKQIATSLLGAKVSIEALSQIHQEIDNSEVISSDAETLINDHKEGFVSTETASQARGYQLGEVEKAKKDHAERLARVKEAQSKATILDESQLNDPKLQKENLPKRGAGK